MYELYTYYMTTNYDLRNLVSFILNNFLIEFYFTSTFKMKFFTNSLRYKNANIVNFVLALPIKIK